MTDKEKIKKLEKELYAIYDIVNERIDTHGVYVWYLLNENDVNKYVETYFGNWNNYRKNHLHTEEYKEDYSFRDDKQTQSIYQEKDEQDKIDWYEENRIKNSKKDNILKGESNG